MVVGPTEYLQTAKSFYRWTAGLDCQADIDRYFCRCIRSPFYKELLYLCFEDEGYTGLTLSALPSVTNIFRHTFLSNHASQPPQTWYGALARGPTSR